MKAKAIWVIGLLVVVGLGYVFYVESFGAPEFVRVSRAKDAVAAQLFDGGSAQFRNVHAVNIISICGEVNAKNRFGAYVGFTKFNVMGNDSNPIISMDKESTDISCN